MTEQKTERPLDDRLRLAYGTAMHACHQGGRVEFHFGSGVVEHLRSLATYANSSPLPDIVRAWGVPVVPASHPDPLHISVHVVETIQ